MDVMGWIGQAKDISYSAFAQATGAVGAGVGYVQSNLPRSWLFVSTESSSSYETAKVDEKHYFLIPDRRTSERYSLYTMRCLPDGVPPINSLPKHRIFHLPNPHALPTIEHLLAVDARDAALANSPKPGASASLGNRLSNLADQIDHLDNKLFNGVLLIGGLVALVNPVAGAAIAFKAMLPSVGLMLSKFGLKYVGETLTSRELAAKVKNAEREVLQQFQGAGTESIVNPLLAQFDKALDTDESEYDPLLDFDSQTMDFGSKDRQRFFELTCQALANTYQQVLVRDQETKAAKLGDEDVRFLKVICNLAKKSG